MSIKESLDLAVSKRNLLEHPFYQAWSTRILAAEALQTYPREYGSVHRLTAEGLGNAEQLRNGAGRTGACRACGTTSRPRSAPASQTKRNCRKYRR